jgi:branched-chain amino acid aminotransferase
MNFVCFNGKFFPAGEPLLDISNRSYKWGDALFETMKLSRGKILLNDLHFERLFLGLRLLGIGINLQKDVLEEQLIQLCEKNNCLDLARIRLAVFRDETGQSGYSIEALPLAKEAVSWNPQGVSLTLYPLARKVQDVFSNLKSASFLPYVLASLYASQNGFDDALVLNAENAIADSSKANIFLCKDGELFTPALHQGCVSGIMRRFVIEHCKKYGIVVHQDIITESDLLAADEVFLTNAIQGIRWVKLFKEKAYEFEKTKALYQQILSPLYSPHS